jgi:undecaprenyl diphosphate synthase
MSQSTTQNKLHVAIIMDGNGRWARARALPRLAGHHAGAKSLREVVEAAPDLDIGILTLYAFSSDNWKRPPEEIDGLMHLLESHLKAERDNCIFNGVRIRVIGRRDRLNLRVRNAIESTERETGCGRTIEVRLAIDYSARDAIAAAAQQAGNDRQRFDQILGPPVDLLIRTGGEQRLSDFLLWECAYAELYFTPCLWPDFGAAALEAALAEFHKRERRFGALPEAVGF